MKTTWGCVKYHAVVEHPKASRGMPPATAATFKWQQVPAIAVWLQQMA